MTASVGGKKREGRGGIQHEEVYSHMYFTKQNINLTSEALMFPCHSQRRKENNLGCKCNLSKSYRPVMSEHKRHMDIIDLTTHAMNTPLIFSPPLGRQMHGHTYVPKHRNYKANPARYARRH